MSASVAVITKHFSLLVRTPSPLLWAARSSAGRCQWAYHPLPWAYQGSGGALTTTTSPVRVTVSVTLLVLPFHTSR